VYAPGSVTRDLGTSPSSVTFICETTAAAISSCTANTSGELANRNVSDHRCELSESTDELRRDAHPCRPPADAASSTCATFSFFAISAMSASFPLIGETRFSR